MRMLYISQRSQASLHGLRKDDQRGPEPGTETKIAKAVAGAPGMTVSCKDWSLPGSKVARDQHYRIWLRVC
jgi:hypothetical protein